MALILAQNLLWAEWISFSASVSVLGLLVIYYSKSVPEALKRIFKYGKAAELHDDAIKKLNKIELPKRWFYHFYLFATTFYIILGWSVIRVYFFRQRMPQFLQELLDSFVGTHRRSSVTPESVIMAMFLIFVQVSRRLSECIFLSVYSDAKMNIIHYVFGYSFYFGVGLSVLAEAPGFEGRGNNPQSGIISKRSFPKGLAKVRFADNFLTWNIAIGFCLFVWSSILQTKCHFILAKLRKDNKGRVVTYRHSIPKGGWFDLISCPHYFAEILIYLSLCVVLEGRSMTWWMVCCFVIINQLIVGLFNHQWYLETFKDYPRHRKAVIPFLV